MYTIKYKDCKRYLVASTLPTPRDPQTVNPPKCVDTVNDSLQKKGHLYEKVCCSYHRYFEWTLHREFFEFSQYLDVTSPVFTVDRQSFYLEMSPKCRYTVSLYRVGPSVTDSIYAWRGGVINFEGTHQDSHFDGEINLSEDLSEWKDGQPLFTLSSSYLHNSCFQPNDTLTFFIRINVIPMNFEENIAIFKGPCNRDTLQTTPINTGSIVEKEWEMYKKVQWDIPCKSIKDSQNNPGASNPSLRELLLPKIVYKSPVFEISSQTFYFSLEISPNSSTSHIVRLYRLGPPVDMTVRWWMQVKNGSNCTFTARNMDLTRSCVAWTYDKHLISFEKMSIAPLTVEFLMSKVDTICGIIQSRSDEDSPLELDPSRTEFLTFRAVKDDFTVHRSLMTMRVPIFEAMLSHDTVESQTGIVCLEDCEPVTIAMLLHYVDTGEGPLFSEKIPWTIIHYTFEVVILSDKYLLPELRDMCLTLLDEISMHQDPNISKMVSIQVYKIENILSTFTPEMLDKFPKIKEIYLKDN